MQTLREQHLNPNSARKIEAAAHRRGLQARIVGEQTVKVTDPSVPGIPSFYVTTFKEFWDSIRQATH